MERSVEAEEQNDGQSKHLPFYGKGIKPDVFVKCYALEVN